MGHRISANVFRVGHLCAWNSQWFAKSEYSYLLSLDYKIRDFLDYILYNLRWPSSELQIKRFLSRTLTLEIIINVPDDQLLHYLESISFLDTHAISQRADILKFNILALDSNYVLFNLLYDVLSKPIFFLLLRKVREIIWYSKSLVSFVYNRLFGITDLDLSVVEHELFRIYEEFTSLNSIRTLKVSAVSQLRTEFLNLLDKMSELAPYLHSLCTGESNGKLLCSMEIRPLLRMYQLFDSSIRFQPDNEWFFDSLESILSSISFKIDQPSIVSMLRYLSLLGNAAYLDLDGLDSSPDGSTLDGVDSACGEGADADQLYHYMEHGMSQNYLPYDVLYKNRSRQTAAGRLTQYATAYLKRNFLLYNRLRLFRKRDRIFSRGIFSRSVFYRLGGRIHPCSINSDNSDIDEFGDVAVSQVYTQEKPTFRVPLRLEDVFMQLRYQHITGTFSRVVSVFCSLFSYFYNKLVEMKREPWKSNSSIEVTSAIAHGCMSADDDVMRVALLPNASDSFLYKPTHFFYHSHLWYCDFGASCFQKIYSSVFIHKYMYGTKFFHKYSNVSYAVIFRKFMDFFTYFKFENTVFISIKLLRYYKKFFLYNKQYSLHFSPIFFIFMYYYISTRFSSAQLYLQNVLYIFNLINSTYSVNGANNLQLCVYLFIYHFFHHLKIINLTLKTLQLAVILKFFRELYLRESVSSNQSASLLFHRINTPFGHSVDHIRSVYCSVRSVYMLQSNILNSLSKRIVFLVASPGLDMYGNCFNISLLKLLPLSLSNPYSTIELSNQFEQQASSGLLSSKQWNELLSNKVNFFFHYVVDNLIFYVDNLRREILPIQSLHFLSSMVEYNLMSYLSNTVVFLPIFYIGKKLPLRQAKMVCTFVSYELEKGMPYFLVLKQVGFYASYRRTQLHEYHFSQFTEVLEGGIPFFDSSFIDGVKNEFTIYRLNMHSQSVLKYFLFRSFRFISDMRGFTNMLGVRISCSGRMHRRQTRSHTMWFARGALPLRTFDKFVDYYSSYAVTRLGTIGVKVWMYLAQFDLLIS